MIGALAWLRYDQMVSYPAPVRIPDQLASLPLTTQLAGKQAVLEVTRLHRKQFPLTAGAVGVYGDHKITLWAGGAPFDFMATRMVSIMRDEIAEGRSPFIPGVELQDGKRVIYSLEGMGQKHYYFQSGRLVVWLAADADLAEIALQQIQEYYP